MKQEKIKSESGEWIKIPELDIEIEKYPSSAIMLSDLKVPSGFRLLSECRKKDNVNEVVFFINNYPDINILNDWEFIEQSFLKNKEKFPYALRRLYRYGDLYLGADVDVLPVSYETGWVRLVRDLK